MLQFLTEKVRSGMAWSADTQVVTGIALNSYIRFKASNPLNSKRLVFIYKLGIFSPDDLTLVAYKNASTAVTANIITPRNQNLTSAANSSLSLAYDIAGSDVTAESRLRTFGVQAGTNNDFTGEIYLLFPGQTLALTAKITASLGGRGLTHLSWVEEDI